MKVGLVSVAPGSRRCLLSLSLQLFSSGSGADVLAETSLAGTSLDGLGEVPALEVIVPSPPC